MMDLIVALIGFACISIGLLVGMLLQNILPALDAGGLGSRESLFPFRISAGQSLERDFRSKNSL